MRTVLSKRGSGLSGDHSEGQTSWQIRHLALILRFQGMDWPFSLSRTLNWANASPWRQMAISFGAVGAIASIAISPIWDQRGEFPQAAIQPRQAHPTASHRPETADASMFKVFALNAFLTPGLMTMFPRAGQSLWLS